MSKTNLKILFIDDNNFPIVDTLKRYGYHCKRIKDISSIDMEDIQNSHIIFIDYQGVGKKISPNEEGVGVSKLLVKNYKNSKYIVLYTARSIPSNIVMDINKPETAHKCIKKDIEPSEYVTIIESAIEKIQINHE